MNNPELRKMIITGTLITAIGMFFGWSMAGIKCSILVLLVGFFCNLIFVLYTKKRYEKLQKLNTYFDTVLSGDYTLELAENEEGELSILHDNIYKATVLLRSQNEKLKADKLFLAEVMADISHQLKTPVTSISIMNDLLENETETERRKEFIDVQRQEVDKISWLIQNLLKLSKLDAGIVALQKESVSLQALLKESLATFVIPMELRQIKLENLAEDVNIMVDPHWTVEVFRNIFKNCIEHMQENGRLCIQMQKTNLYLDLIISDDGCGINPEDLPHIFERFYRGKDAAPGSIGIGLAMAKSILEKENAEISASSRLGEGTTFNIRFYHSII